MLRKMIIYKKKNKWNEFKVIYKNNLLILSFFFIIKYGLRCPIGIYQTFHLNVHGDGVLG